jgi:hypothetical protein
MPGSGIGEGPHLRLISRTLYEGEPFGFTREMAVKFGMQRILDDSRKVYSELRKRGVRALIGGDYGFAQTPMACPRATCHGISLRTITSRLRRHSTAMPIVLSSARRRRNPPSNGARRRC